MTIINSGSITHKHTPSWFPHYDKVLHRPIEIAANSGH